MFENVSVTQLSNREIVVLFYFVTPYLILFERTICGSESVSQGVSQVDDSEIKFKLMKYCERKISN